VAERDFDVAVVGGGLVGASLAWGLARANQRVVVLDEGDLAVRATRGNFALVWVQGKGMGLPAYAHWSLGSARAWPELARALREETGLDVCLRQGGGLHMCLSEAEWAARERTLAAFHAQPGMPDYRTEMLGRRELDALVPGTGPAVVGASYSREDGHVNSLRLFRALLVGLQRCGVDYRPWHTVDGITREAGGFRIDAYDAGAAGAGTAPAPSAAGRACRAAKVVLAAGNANRTLAPLVGLHAPMLPEQGQILVTERLAPFMPLPLSTLRQTDEGSLLIGDSRAAGTVPEGLDGAINTVLARRAVQVFPQLARVQIVRSWRAVRVMPRDGFPIYQQSQSHPGAFVATCHSGVTLAAAHALKLAPMIASGVLDPSVTPFSGARFQTEGS
jgi:glycine/D-amino acid oxidase-like deaminating enzyme